MRDANRHLTPDLEQSLRQARDDKIAQVVAMVDALALRGGADALIAPLRPRLAQLRPPRPLNFCRLLFTPFDPVIVPPRHWRPGDPALPRSALMPLAATVERELGPGAVTIDPERETLAAAGARIWPEAGRVLLRAPPPEQWGDTGFPFQVYAPLARAVGAVLGQEPALAALPDAVARNDPGPVETMLRQIPPEAMRLLVALALARAPQASALLARTGHGAASIVAELLENPAIVEARLAAVPLQEAAARVGEHAAGLRALIADSLAAETKRRWRAVQQRLDQVSRSRFAAALETELLLPLSTLTTRDADSDTTAIESVARDLRALESEARTLGGAEVYDRLLRQAADTVRDRGKDGAMSKAETIRLVEILAGSAAALALL